MAFGRGLWEVLARFIFEYPNLTKRMGFASKVEFSIFVLLREFLDRFFGAIRAVHELHATHEIA